MPTNSKSDPGRPSGRSGGIGSALTLVGIAALVLVAGCSPPQVEPEHRELVLMLATASSTRDTALLERAAGEIDELRTEGSLSSAEASAFDAIVSDGRSGNWDRAQRRAYALRDAQRPTQADLDRIKDRPLSPTRTLGSDDPD